IDDEFPNICQAVLTALYPHYLAPTPPTTIVRLELSDKSTESTEPYRVPRGARIETEAFDGEPCRFRTGFDTRLWPIEVAQVEYLNPPFPFETSPWNRDALAAIRMRITAASPKLQLDQLGIDQLRLF